MSQLRFVHVGLGKCASTYLQSAWIQDARYVAVDSSAYAVSGRKFAAQEKKIPAISQRLSVNEMPGQYAMSSCESFLYGYDTDPKVATTMMRSLFDNSAQIISSIVDTQKILVVVRDPVAWVQSAFTQAIKQGGSETYAEFLDTYGTWIQRSLDLRKINELFGRRFDTVALMSSDDLRHRPDFFWGRYESIFDCPRPNEPKTIPLQQNESLSKENIKRLMVFNRFRKMFRQFFDAPGMYQKSSPILGNEYEGLLEKFPQLNSDFNWIARRFFEFADEELLSDADHLLGAADVFAGEVSRGICSTLRASFLEVLADVSSISDEAKSQYERSLGK